MSRYLTFQFKTVLLLSMALLLACASNESPTISTRDLEPETKKETQDPVLPLNPIELMTCKQMYAALELALERHMAPPTRNVPQYITSILYEIQTALSGQNADPSLVPALHKNVEPISNCLDLFMTLRKLPTPEQKLHSFDTPFILKVRTLLAQAINSLDIFSSYSPDGTLFMNPDQKGSGLMFRDHAEYHLPDPTQKAQRKPLYLVVDGYAAFLNPHLPIGTRIYAVNGTEIKAHPYSYWIRLLSFGQKVAQLSVLASNPLAEPLSSPCKEIEANLFECPLKMDAYLPSVAYFRWQNKEHGVAYLRLTSFLSNHTAENLSKEWDHFVHKEAQDDPLRVKVLIMDLRGNLGGQVDEIQRVADSFFPPQSTLAHRERAENPLPALKTLRSPGTLGSIPKIVLIDHRTASASEILAAAIQDFGRGILLGSPSYGKSKELEARPLDLPLGGNLILTTVHWYRPSGKLVPRTGIEPDIGIDDPAFLSYLTQLQRPLLRVADITGRYSGSTRDRRFLDIDSPEECRFCDTQNDFSEMGRLHLGEAITQLTSSMASQDQPRACEILPQDDDFQEEFDCVLAWAELYALEMKNSNVAVRSLYP